MTAGRLRVVACGSVGDGKSTLLSRLLHEPAREQGNTIDVACRHFETPRRKYIVVDAPGLEQHTRNMVTGASTADAAIVLVDARKGLLVQTRRHTLIAHLLGIRRLVLAVNKMDLVEYSPQVFTSIEQSFRRFAFEAGLGEVSAIPVCALEGHNVWESKGQTPWYQGPSLMPALEAMEVEARGEVLPAAPEPAQVADQFDATVVWMGDAPLLPGRDYLMKVGACTVTATVAPLRHRIDVNTLEHMAADKLLLNEIGACQLELDRPVAFEPYAVNRDLGGFVLIDRITQETVAAGMLNFALRRSQNVRWQALDIDRDARAAAKGQRPVVLWFTGLSGAGKSTIANLVEKRLHAMGRHTYLLDGDNVRHGLNKDLGFTEEARVENIRRVAEVARLMADAGLIVLCAFISPFRSERRMARALLPPGEFIEVFVDAPLALAEQRDPKGLYRKARAGELANFTGIDSPYEAPEAAEIRIDTSTESPDEACERILERLANLPA